jgi:glycyl-tRNA synthetase
MLRIASVQARPSAAVWRPDTRRLDYHPLPAMTEPTPTADAGTDTVTMEKIVALCKRRGFVFPSSEIYGGVGSTYDFGHYGVLLKGNVKNEWWRAMLQERDDIVAIDSAILQHPRVWEASGHLAGFTDPLVDCKTCGQRFRADHLADLPCGRKPSKHPGETDECDLTDARDFNLMFETTIGPVKESGATAYLRPETAQGIFINFKNVLQFSRKKPPFGIAQVGKSFRNEITPGNFIFRTREFEQMEMEFFVPPADAQRWFEHWLAERERWYTELGIRPDHLRLRAHDPDELSHYSSGTSDVEYLFPSAATGGGARWSELEGIANRGDFDLTQHAKFSGEKLEYFDQATGERYVPHVIEPAAGADRATLAFLVDAYDEELVEREGTGAGELRTVLRLHPRLAPVKVAVLPLVGKDGQPELAREVHRALRGRVQAEYDEGGAIGKRYRRQDEIGTPLCLTIDHQSTEDNTLTLRDRDSLAQERLPIEGIADEIERRVHAPWSTPKLTTE